MFKSFFISLTVLLIGQASLAISFQEVMDSYPEITISPVSYRSLPLSVAGSTVCLIAGYQIAVKSEYKKINKGESYLYVPTGWANGTAVSGFDFFTKTTESADTEILANVTCRKKLKIQ